MSLAGSIASMTARSRIVAGERHLDDDAIDGRVVVELADRGRHLGLGRLALELDEAAIDPDLGAAAQDPLEVDGRRRVLARR